MHKTCPICGIGFSSKSICCSCACGAKYRRMNSDKKAASHKKANKSIIDIQKEAEKLHMTYGQYVAIYGG